MGKYIYVIDKQQPDGVELMPLNTLLSNVYQCLSASGVCSECSMYGMTDCQWLLADQVRRYQDTLKLSMTY